MAKRGLNVGMVLLLIVMAVVLVLVANSWSALAPVAFDTQDALNSGPLSDHGQPQAADAVREGGMPGLRDAQAETDQHSAQVQQALDAIE